MDNLGSYLSYCSKSVDFDSAANCVWGLSPCGQYVAGGIYEVFKLEYEPMFLGENGLTYCGDTVTTYPTLYKNHKLVIWRDGEIINYPEMPPDTHGWWLTDWNPDNSAILSSTGAFSGRLSFTWEEATDENAPQHFHWLFPNSGSPLRQENEQLLGVNIHGTWVGTRQGYAIVGSNPANMSNVATPGPDGIQFVAAGEAYAINAGGSFLTRPETDWFSQMFATLPAGHQHLLHYKDPATGTLRKWQWNDILAKRYDAQGNEIPGDYTITMVHAMNDHHVATATVIHNPSGQTKQALLVPFELNSDLNNDGRVGEGSDSSLKTAALQSGASDDTKEKGTEYLFVNDQFSNGLWDKEDSDSSKPAGENKDDDVTELKTICAATWGGIWFEFEGGDISKLEFWKNKECTEAFTFDPTFALSESNKMPEKLYVRTKGDWAGQVEGKLIMKFGKPDKSETWAEDKLLFTVVKQFGDSKYFHAARDYILENNTKFFVHKRRYSGTEFRIVCMREEATTMTAIDTSRTSPVLKGIDDVKNSYGSSTVIINGNQCFFADDRNKFFASLAREITDKCHGRIVREGALDNAVSSDNTDETTSPKGSPLAGDQGNYLAQNGNAFYFGKGRVPQGFQSAMGGLSTFYASPRRVNSEHQMVGYCQSIEQSKGIVFIATQTSGVGKAVEFSEDAKKSGVKNLSGAGEGRLELLILDGSSSVALVYENPSGLLQRIVAGAKHVGPEYFINTYLLFNCERPR